MIRKLTEYGIRCDAEKVLGEQCHGDDSMNVFGSPTQGDCAASAIKYGWRRITKRFWLCDKCVVRYDEKQGRQNG